MRRKCVKCNNLGIKVGRIVLTGPTYCEFCKTEYEAARYANLPYAATGTLAILFLLTWLTGRFDAMVFLLMSGAWLVFQFAWEALVPLRPIEGNEKERDDPVRKEW